ncbi:Flp family type IVb pilin [Rhodoferax sediminis]|uniref:Flp family type IVb pilin n=1 Tax=Rhodoferax sediminis TaxID=2509614 RepID=A0A515D9Q2_9BURK|nr:Flp family type IVb pilin [Rhodoferax sediminis]QDL37135.1 Flp family type IVb pilin [Rhodoferax sediminis]
MDFIKNFMREEDGVTAIEYGLIASLVAVAIVGGASLLGTDLNLLFNNLAACMAAPSAANCALGG